jgi:hypothetical protein
MMTTLHQHQTNNPICQHDHNEFCDSKPSRNRSVASNESKTSSSSSVGRKRKQQVTTARMSYLWLKDEQDDEEAIEWEKRQKRKSEFGPRYARPLFTQTHSKQALKKVQQQVQASPSSPSQEYYQQVLLEHESRISQAMARMLEQEAQAEERKAKELQRQAIKAEQKHFELMRLRRWEQ